MFYLSPKKLLLRYRRFLVALGQAALISFSLMTAFLLRFDFHVPEGELRHLAVAVMIAIPVKLFVFYFAGLNRGWWQYAGLPDLARIFVANVFASGCLAATYVIQDVFRAFPRSIYLIDLLVCFFLTAGMRFALRLYNEVLLADLPNGGNGPRKRILIYGAGHAGITLVREIRSNSSLRTEVAGFLDDDRRKYRARFLGVPVIGRGRDAVQIIESLNQRDRKIDEIIIAMPSATGAQMREAVANCRATGVGCKTIPGLGDLLQGTVLTSQIRNLSIADLLGREPVQLEEDRIQIHIHGKSVLVTGGAGSIGSELCRQIATYEPSLLVILDQAESELYKIDIELRQRFPLLTIVPEIADMRDAPRLNEVMRQHQIQLVFHAAAYKHVPLMEAHIIEAATNNVIGTWNLVQAAQSNGVSHFLMISSDKAVNPTNIMGTTKRIAELIVSAMSVSGRSGLRFASVRFGNVLGSNGSVVPLFQSQIAAGGPVTVTHPQMRRYFMTIREAVQLVLQASTMGKGAEIFVLDMGEPVRIVDLAKNMIRLAGFTPDEDIEIRFVGLRPGEKLYEELITSGENILPTYHKKIKIFVGEGVTAHAIYQWIAELEDLISVRDSRAIQEHFLKMVPEYTPQGDTSDRYTAATA